MKKIKRPEVKSKADAKAIKNFINFIIAGGKSKNKNAIKMRENHLIFLSAWIPVDFDKLQRRDVEKVFADLRSGKIKKVSKSQKDCIPQPYKEKSISDFGITFKMFFRWFKGEDEIYPKEVAWLKPSPILKNQKKIQANYLKPKDIQNLINATSNIRNRAFISMLYESGCRLGEILTLKINDISFNRNGAKITVSGKTGERTLLLVESVPYLNDWLKVHKFKDDEKAPLWIREKSLAEEGREHKRLSEKSKEIYEKYKCMPVCGVYIYNMLKDLAKKTGINKAVNPHNLRHSRITFLASRDDMSDQVIKKYAGWTPASTMLDVYANLNNRQVDNAILKMQGIKISEEELEKGIGFLRCPFCGAVNTPLSKVCNKCNQFLNAEEEMIKKIKTEILQELTKTTYERGHANVGEVLRK